jgi:hypothetical protein
MAKKYLPLYNLLIDSSDTQRKAIVNTLSAEQTHAVAEAIYNVLHGTCPINNKDKKTLAPRSAVMRRLVAAE